MESEGKCKKKKYCFFHNRLSVLLLWEEPSKTSVLSDAHMNKVDSFIMTVIVLGFISTT